VSIPRDSGAGGVAANMFMVRYLSEEGLIVKSVKMSGHRSKLQRALPFFAMAEAGLVKIVRDHDGDRWIENMLLELENFEENSRVIKDDQLDAIADATSYLLRGNVIPDITIGSFTNPSPIPTIS